MTSVAVRKVRVGKTPEKNKKAKLKFEHFGDSVKMDEQSALFYKRMMANEPITFKDYLNEALKNQNGCDGKLKGRIKLKKISKFTPM